MNKPQPAVSAENKQIAKFVAAAFGGKPAINFYHHDTQDLAVAVLRVPDCPSEGLTAYATLLLSDYPLIRDGKEFPTRVEFVGVCETAQDKFANILSSAAFCIIRASRFIQPGDCLPDYVAEYYPDTTVPHLYFTAPFLWEGSLRTTKFDQKTVSWLLAMPISDAERLFLKEKGDNALEDLFEGKGVDTYDLWRDSAV
jgi:hypothetical protein